MDKQFIKVAPNTLQEIVIEPQACEISVQVQEGAQCHVQYRGTQMSTRSICCTLTLERDAFCFFNVLLGTLGESTQADTINFSVQLHLNGQGAQAEVTGKIITRKKQRHIFVTEQIHQARNTRSSVCLKAVVQEAGIHQYRSLIRLEPASLGADARQENKILLLDKTAYAASDPTLQILHDQVSCSHGSAISQIDPEQIFYFQSRGIHEKSAQESIVNGFLSE